MEIVIDVFAGIGFLTVAMVVGLLILIQIDSWKYDKEGYFDEEGIFHRYDDEEDEWEDDECI